MQKLEYNYKEFRTVIQNGTFQFDEEKIAEYQDEKVHLMIFTKEMNEEIQLFYQMIEDDGSYRFSGFFCHADELPKTEKGFWKMIKKRIVKKK